MVEDFVTQKSPLNDTIALFSQNPFSCETKNKLLQRLSDQNKFSFENSTTNAPKIQANNHVKLMGSTFEIIKLIGQGAYAKVFAIRNKKTTLALKLDKQSTAWEYYISETLHERIIAKKFENMLNSFVSIKGFIKFNDGCISTMNGSLMVRIFFF